MGRHIATRDITEKLNESHYLKKMDLWVSYEFKKFTLLDVASHLQGLAFFNVTRNQQAHQTQSKHPFFEKVSNGR